MFLPPMKSVRLYWGGGGRIGAPDDLSDVITNFENFKTLKTFHYLSSYRFDLGLKETQNTCEIVLAIENVSCEFKCQI